MVQPWAAAGSGRAHAGPPAVPCSTGEAAGPAFSTQLEPSCAELLFGSEPACPACKHASAAGACAPVPAAARARHHCSGGHCTCRRHSRHERRSMHGFKQCSYLHWSWLWLRLGCNLCGQRRRSGSKSGLGRWLRSGSGAGSSGTAGTAGTVGTGSRSVSGSRAGSSSS